jgi:thiamine kinase-like enzyme
MKADSVAPVVRSISGDDDRRGDPFNIDNIAFFLIRRGLLSPEDVLCGSLRIEASNNRSRNFRVFKSDQSGLFIKQPDDLMYSSRATLQSEASFYHQRASLGDRIAPHIPAIAHYEPEVPFLALELLPLHNTLSDSAASLGPEAIRIYADLGRRLADLHLGLTKHRSNAPDWAASLDAAVPWVMQAHRPPIELLATLGPASLQMLKIIQGSNAIQRGLDDLSQIWHPTVVVHGDMRNENVLVRMEPGLDPNIVFVDWEFIQYGDPAWDIGCLLQGLVANWLNGLDLAESEGISDIIASCSATQPALEASCKALWDGYSLIINESGGETARVSTTKVVQFSAARMIQSAWQSANHRQLAPAAILQLQIAENVFSAPEETGFQLFGLR